MNHRFFFMVCLSTILFQYQFFASTQSSNPPSQQSIIMAPFNDSNNIATYNNTVEILQNIVLNIGNNVTTLQAIATTISKASNPTTPPSIAPLPSPSPTQTTIATQQNFPSASVGNENAAEAYAAFGSGGL